jgi:hypothetical protein
MASKAKIIKVGAVLFGLLYTLGITYAMDDEESPCCRDEECRRRYEVPYISPQERRDRVGMEERRWPVALREALDEEGTIIIQRILTGESKGQL